MYSIIKLEKIKECRILVNHVGLGFSNREQSHGIHQLKFGFDPNTPSDFQALGSVNRERETPSTFQPWTHYRERGREQSGGGGSSGARARWWPWRMSEHGTGTRGRMWELQRHLWCDTMRQSSEVLWRRSEAVRSEDEQRRMASWVAATVGCCRWRRWDGLARGRGWGRELLLCMRASPPLFCDQAHVKFSQQNDPWYKMPESIYLWLILFMNMFVSSWIVAFLAEAMHGEAGLLMHLSAMGYKLN